MNTRKRIDEKFQRVVSVIVELDGVEIERVDANVLTDTSGNADLCKALKTSAMNTLRRMGHEDFQGRAYNGVGQSEPLSMPTDFGAERRAGHQFGGDIGGSDSNYRQ